ncbi:MAG: CAP domain-containing protein [Burkholderiaceae bacterium]|nr:CAP domain-containing protein [Burkholderiaceae bacterium]
MHDTFYCGRRALATFAFGLFACFQAMAAEPLPEGAAEMINAVRQQAAGCGEALRATVSRDARAALTPTRQALVWNPQLAQAAEQHSREMAKLSYFDHIGRDGSRVSQRADAAGYRWRSIAENLAAGYSNLADALRGWIRSEGHCRNLLDERYSEFGLARVVSERPGDRYRVYWTLVLGRPAQPTLRIEGQN